MTVAAFGAARPQPLTLPQPLPLPLSVARGYARLAAQFALSAVALTMTAQARRFATSAAPLTNRLNMHGRLATLSARPQITPRCLQDVPVPIGALKGPLHGGANEAVMHDMLEIGSADRASEWLQGKLARKDKIVGFGHRVYKNGDSRVPTMKQALMRVAAARDGQRWLDIYEVLERGMAAATGIKPDLDFPAGPAYHLMGFDISFFTPIFVMSRITGWTAHIWNRPRPTP
jgi:hypothetical protein